MRRLNDGKIYLTCPSKISSIQAMKDLFSFLRPFKALNLSPGSREIHQLANDTFFHFPFKDKHKNGERIVL